MKTARTVRRVKAARHPKSSTTAPDQPRSGLRVAVTGASSDFGRLVLPRLQGADWVSEILSIEPDNEKSSLSLSTRVRRLSTTFSRPESEAEVASALEAFRADVLLHLSFVNSPVHSATFAHELECLGSLHLLAAATRAGVKRVVMPSLTALYGPIPQHPAFISEEALLAGVPGSRFIQDRIDIEGYLHTYAQRDADASICILRFPAVAGPVSDNTFTRLMRSRVIPTVLGFDPLWQVLHEDDAADALCVATRSTRSGTFNVAPSEALPFSAIVRWAGARAVPMPFAVLKRLSRLSSSLGFRPVPPALLPYLRYACVADNTKMKTQLGFQPQFSIVEALQQLHATEKRNT
jgi:UDP-glucose 4-epimerase